MTADQFRASLEALDMPQRVFAQRAGVTPEAVNRWCSGKNAVPEWASWLISSLLELDAEPSES